MVYIYDRVAIKLIAYVYNHVSQSAIDTAGESSVTRRLVEAMVRGCHLSGENWDPSLGDQLACKGNNLRLPASP